MDPQQLKFSKTHEWVRIDGHTATVGISDFAVKELTDLVYIELPTVGSTVTAGKTFGEVESVKAVSDLYSPVTGEVKAVNEQLPGDLSLLSSDPYGAGWVAKVLLTDAGPLNALMDYAKYQEFCAAGGH
jgi:glycine cleavage system H protein